MIEIVTLIVNVCDNMKREIKITLLDHLLSIEIIELLVSLHVACTYMDEFNNTTIIAHDGMLEYVYGDIRHYYTFEYDSYYNEYFAVADTITMDGLHTSAKYSISIDGEYKVLRECRDVSGISSLTISALIDRRDETEIWIKNNAQIAVN